VTERIERGFLCLLEEVMFLLALKMSNVGRGYPLAKVSDGNDAREA
jgi:hypothetical protein